MIVRSLVDFPFGPLPSSRALVTGTARISDTASRREARLAQWTNVSRLIWCSRIYRNRWIMLADFGSFQPQCSLRNEGLTNPDCFEGETWGRRFARDLLRDPYQVPGAGRFRMWGIFRLEETTCSE